MILEDGAEIQVGSLPMAVGHSGNGPVPMMPMTPTSTLPEMGLSLEDNEKQLILRALDKTGGNQTQAAKLLKITRDTLRYKMKKFKLR